jgi:predicted DNA-binding protein
MKQASPLAVRFSPKEKIELSKIAQQFGATRHGFIKHAVYAYVRELKAEQLAEVMP